MKGALFYEKTQVEQWVKIKDCLRNFIWSSRDIQIMKKIIIESNNK